MAVTPNDLPPDIRQRLAAENPHLAGEILGTTAKPTIPRARPGTGGGARTTHAPSRPRSSSSSTPSPASAKSSGARKRAGGVARAGRKATTGVARVARAGLAQPGRRPGQIAVWFAGVTVLLVIAVELLSDRGAGAIAAVATWLAAAVKKLADPANPLLPAHHS